MEIFPACHVSFQGFPLTRQLYSGPDHLVEAGALGWPSWEGWKNQQKQVQILAIKFSHLVMIISVGVVYVVCNICIL